MRVIQQFIQVDKQHDLCLKTQICKKKKLLLAVKHTKDIAGAINWM